MGTALLLISAMTLISPRPYLLPLQEGGGSGSEVTSLINELAMFASVRNAICSQLMITQHIVQQ